MFTEEIQTFLEENPVLKAFLKPLEPYLKSEGLIELNVNQAGELRLEKMVNGKRVIEFIKDPYFNFNYLHHLCHIMANGSGFLFDVEKQPRVSTELPGGHRFEAMVGKHSKKGIAISIRLKRPVEVSLETFGVTGHLKEKLIRWVEKGANLIISGGTSSGKTTFLNALIQYIPANTRILTVEDTYELEIPHQDTVNYRVSRNEENPTVGYPQMLDHLLRSTPDVIIAGEVSIQNAYPILKMLNSGHSGFMCTVHANTPQLALKLAIPQNVALSGMNVPDVDKVLYKLIDVVIQVHKIKDGKRVVTELFFPKQNKKVKVYGRSTAQSS